MFYLEKHKISFSPKNRPKLSQKCSQNFPTSFPNKSKNNQTCSKHVPKHSQNSPKTVHNFPNKSKTFKNNSNNFNNNSNKSPQSLKIVKQMSKTCQKQLNISSGRSLPEVLFNLLHPVIGQLKGLMNNKRFVHSFRIKTRVLKLRCLAFSGGSGGFRELREAGRNHFHLILLPDRVRGNELWPKTLGQFLLPYTVGFNRSVMGHGNF